MAEASRPVPKRLRLWVLGAASLLVLAAVMNLVLVAEGQPSVAPDEVEGRTWQTGSEAAEPDGRQTWTFTIDPNGRKVVDLAVSIPYSVRVTHVSGETSLLQTVTWWVDGERLDRRSERISALPEDNTSRVSRTYSTPGTFDSDLQVRRDAPGPFVLLIHWDWNLTVDAASRVTFTTTTESFSVDAVDANGIPGCDGPGCARGSLVVAVLGQLAAVAWFRSAPKEKGPSRADRAAGRPAPVRRP